MKLFQRRKQVMNIKVTKSQKVIVGVTGGIAAYKSCELVRLLLKSGHEVKVIMTEYAKQFIHPNTFAALTRDEVYDDMFASNGDSMVHISLAKWADTIVIAPATATTISKLAIGSADNLLTSVCLATEAKCFVAAAMNKVMWNQPATQKNIATLATYGYSILMPEDGEQACGDVGAGRMLEPDRIVQQLFNTSNLLSGLKILITAGPTQEKIDPVRYISNFSSGKMGYSLAAACQQLGAEVRLISGPTHLTSPIDCKLNRVTTAEEMLNAVMESISSSDIFISTAAIADYTPAALSPSKIKKSSESLSIELKRTTDILKAVTSSYPKVFTVGFCAETDNIKEYAKQKLKDKKLHAIVANHISNEGYPFGEDTNELLYMNHSGTTQLQRDSKTNLALQLAHYIHSDFSKIRLKMAGIVEA